MFYPRVLLANSLLESLLALFHARLTRGCLCYADYWHARSDHADQEPLPHCPNPRCQACMHKFPLAQLASDRRRHAPDSSGGPKTLATAL